MKSGYSVRSRFLFASLPIFSMEKWLGELAPHQNSADCSTTALTRFLWPARLG